MFSIPLVHIGTGYSNRLLCIVGHKMFLLNNTFATFSVDLFYVYSNFHKNPLLKMENVGWSKQFPRFLFLLLSTMVVCVLFFFLILNQTLIYNQKQRFICLFCLCQVQFILFYYICFSSGIKTQTYISLFTVCAIFSLYILHIFNCDGFCIKVIQLS